MSAVPTITAWQYGTPMPAWVTALTRWNDLNELLLCRRSGDQVIRFSEWIVLGLDAEPCFFTNDQFTQRFLESSAAPAKGP